MIANKYFSPGRFMAAARFLTERTDFSMFGFHPDKLVKEGKWEKLESEVGKVDAEKCKEIAAACATSKEDGAYNVLISILDKDDRACKLAAIKALGEQGRGSSATHLMHLMDASAGDEEMIHTIDTALEQIHSHHES